MRLVKIGVNYFNMEAVKEIYPQTAVIPANNGKPILRDAKPGEPINAYRLWFGYNGENGDSPCADITNAQEVAQHTAWLALNSESAEMALEIKSAAAITE